MLMNYVALEESVPTRLHFTDSYYVERLIASPDSPTKRKVRSLVFWVDELNGEPAARTFSVLSAKLAALFEPFLVAERFFHYDFVITKEGIGFATEFRVQPILRPSPPGG